MSEHFLDDFFYAIRRAEDNDEAFPRETNAARMLPPEFSIAPDVLQPFHREIHVNLALSHHIRVV